MLQQAREAFLMRSTGLLALRCVLTLALVLTLVLDLSSDPQLVTSLVILAAVLLV